MTVPTLLVLAAMAATGQHRVIESFDYPGVEAARQAWQPGPGTLSFELVREGPASYIEVGAPFGTDPKLLRTTLDRHVELDLTVPQRFTLGIAADKPEAVGNVTLYFKSGDGWYAAGWHLGGTGRQELTFTKDAFGTEDRPDGWHRIDGIRIACWRGEAVDATVRFSSLEASWSPVAVVVPSGNPDDPELSTARRAIGLVAGLLGEEGIAVDRVEEASLARGSLGDRRVAILAYNPRLSPEATAALVAFVERGGKVFACYTLPRKLADALGIGPMQYHRPDDPGELAEIRLDAPDVTGLPASVRQGSWNITVAEPAGHNARVIGRWYTAGGEPTGHAALLLSDRGAFFSHVVLGDDRQGKRQMLTAVLGHLEPRLWTLVLEHGRRRVGEVGHFAQDPDPTARVERVEKYVRENGPAEAIDKLAEFERTLQAADARAADKRVAESVELLRQAHGQLAAAYLLAQPSREVEGRAVWNHSGTGAYPGDWKRSARVLADAGFNMVLPNMLWAGRAYYPSDVLPRSRTYEEHGDQIAQCVEACHERGIEVHVWKVNWNLSGAPREFVEKLRREGRTQVTVRGEPYDWLCPSHPANLELELESMIEVARRYDVDGLHFDYIRYPGRQCCYCDGCRERFESYAGARVGHWPQDCYDGPLHDSYHDWRCRQITRLVEAVHREAKRIKPEIEISAAVFGAYPDCRESVGQDWAAWIEAGLLDFVCPMDYTESDERFRGLIRHQLELAGGRVPVYPGIGATAARSGLSADRVVGQIHHARSLGAAGFTIFNFQEGTAEEIIPGVRLGATRRPAVPPHGK